MTGSLLRRSFLILVLGGIFYLSHQPSLDIVPPLFPFQDKALHAVEFFVLGLAMLLNRDILGGLRCIWAYLALGGSYAILDEAHQSFVPGRDCSAGDLVADLSGLCLCYLLMSGVIRGGDTASAPESGGSGEGTA